MTSSTVRDYLSSSVPNWKNSSAKETTSTHCFVLFAYFVVKKCLVCHGARSVPFRVFRGLMKSSGAARDPCQTSVIPREAGNPSRMGEQKAFPFCEIGLPLRGNDTEVGQ